MSNKHTKDKGDGEMSDFSKLSPEKQKNLWEQARKNTKRDEKGQATISRLDDDFNDDVWEKLYE